MVGIEDIRRAGRSAGDLIHRTPLVGSATISRMTERPVFLKLENFQKTGSFKPRGALNKIRSLDAEQLRRGVSTVSAGNHAQGVAYVAGQVGTKAVVVMPATSSPAKAEAARSYGAEVILHGDASEAFKKVEEVSLERQLTFVHPFDDDYTIAGQGTVGLEIAEDLPDVECVVVPIGGGGLISGVSLAVKALQPSVCVIGVEPAGAPAMNLSRAKGEPVRLERMETIADGLCPPFVGARNFEIAQRFVDDLVIVDDSEIRAAMRVLLERCKILPEASGAAAMAALLSGKVPGEGKTVVVVSGGNISLDKLAACLRD